MIIVTGGAGFIGSAMIAKLNEKGLTDILCVDHWNESEKWKNILKKNIYDAIPDSRLFQWIEGYHGKIEAIIHMGACSSTTQKDMGYLVENNLHFSQQLFQLCVMRHIPFLYASSAATYGDGLKGYTDDELQLTSLKPINPYGLSKHLFDLWVLKQRRLPPFWAGFKFFNVYGPNEYHKGPMKSLVAKAVPQIVKDEPVGLFKSYKEGYKDGEQLRDFVYIKDVVSVLDHFLTNHESLEISSGIYNVGTGTCRSFYDLIKAAFEACQKPTKISWIEMPLEMRNQYQYYTQADLTKLRQLGKYTSGFTSLEDGVTDYVKNYLLTEDPYI